MYTPKLFAETDRSKLIQIIRENSFGILFSADNGAPTATHLPFLVEDDDTALTLFGHFAKANPHWRHAGKTEALVVFSGPHTYISPSWYEADNTVPTWNYIAVHAYGHLILTSETETLNILQKTVDFYERDRTRSWTFDVLQDFYQKLAKGIVGFRIQVSRLEGKRKLSQNQSLERQQRVVAALQNSSAQNDQAIAALIADNLKK